MGVAKAVTWVLDRTNRYTAHLGIDGVVVYRMAEKDSRDLIEKPVLEIPVEFGLIANFVAPRVGCPKTPVGTGQRKVSWRQVVFFLPLSATLRAYQS